jgi:hypothetical protein
MKNKMDVVGCLVNRLVRIIESCPTCKGEGELECVHADLFRCYSCRGTGKNKTFRLGKVWGLGMAFEVYNEDYQYTGFRQVAACKIYVGPLLVNLRVPVSKVIYPNVKAHRPPEARSHKEDGL